MSDTRVIYRPWWNSDKEELWLNDLAAEGWAMVDMFLLRYVFKRCEPSEYTYRIQLLDKHALSRTSQKYIRFVEDTGAEYVTCWIWWVYFRKKTAEGPLELHTDRASRLKYLQRLRKFWLSMAIMEFVIGISNVLIGLSSGVRNAPMNTFLGLLLILIGYGLFRIAQPIKERIKRLEDEMVILE